MEKLSKYDYCEFCGKDVTVTYKKVVREATFYNKKFRYLETAAYCDECGEELCPHGLWDLNNEELDEQYRKVNYLVTVDNLNWLLKTYGLGKTTLAQALGLGKVTIARYFDGCFPSAEVSELAHRASSNPKFFIGLLEANKKKLKPATYEKALGRAKELKKAFDASRDLRFVLNYYLTENEYMNAAQVQKILYFTDAIYGKNQSKKLLQKACEAWTYGPVYPDIYNIFKNYGDVIFGWDEYYLFKVDESKISDELKETCKLVLDTFGMFDAKFLVELSHREDPWKNAHAGFPDNTKCSEPITHDSIMEYYDKVGERFDLTTRDGIMAYIKHVGIEGKTIYE